jgi:beta-ketoacyl ACP synthase
MTRLRTGDGFANVVVTAVAATTSLAPDAEQTWQFLLDGRSGIRELDFPFLAEFDSPVRIGGPLQENFDEQLTRIELRRLSNMQKMSVLLGRRLWESAGTPEIDTRRLMVSIGIAMGVTEEIRAQHDAWKEKGLRSVSPLAVQMYMPNAPAAAVGLEHHAKAGIISPVMADASGGAAIHQAWRQLVLGEADVAICGGVEARIEPVPSL